MYETTPPMYYSPTDMQRLRLERMEQAYPQFADPYRQPVQQPRPQYTKCFPVTGYDEAKACRIDLDGTMTVFTDIANGKIYTKQVGLDGNAHLNVYALANAPAQTQMQQQPVAMAGPGDSDRQSEQKPGYVTADMLDDMIQNQVQDMVQREVERRLKQYIGGSGDDQSVSSNRPRNATTVDEPSRGQSTFSAGTGDGAGEKSRGARASREQSVQTERH